MISPRQDALADLAEKVAAALSEFAVRLREQPDTTTSASTETPPAAEEPATPDRSKLGDTQARILRALEEAGEQGLTATQVAEQIGIKATNAPRTLRALRARGLAMGDGERPEVWRVIAAQGQ